MKSLPQRHHRARRWFAALGTSVLAALLMSALVPMVALGRQQTMPAPSAPRPVNIPKPVEKTLKNGLRVIVVEDRDVPLVTAQLLIKSGGEVDPPQLSGAANLTAELLTKGTKTRTAPDIARAIEALGGSINTGAGWDMSYASVSVMSPKLTPAMEIMADVVRHPNFEEEELERLRRQYIDGWNVSMRQPGTIANHVAARVVFGDGAYGHPLNGTLESLTRVKRDDIVQIHATYYRPDHAVLVVAGDIRPDAMFKLAERFFGGWVKPASSPASLRQSVAAEATPAAGQSRVVVVDMPEAGQTAVMLARPGVKRADADYMHGLVTNSVFGGNYSSRLNQEVRIKRGLSYGAYSSLGARRETGWFTISTQTKNESGADVASLFVSELERLARDPIPADEMTPRKASLIGDFARGLETANGLVGQIVSLALHDLGLDQINTFINRVQAVSESDIRRFAATRLDTGAANVILVGQARQFLPALRRQFPHVEVMALSDLDLNSASLRKQTEAGTETASMSPRYEDVTTLDGIIKAFYDVISGPAGEPRQWDRDRTLYIPGVRFVAMSTQNGKTDARVMDHQTYVERVNDFFVRQGFFEREIHRVTRRFGNMAHVFSTYEWSQTPDGKVGGRGVNSLELFFDGRRWWIAAALWSDESPSHPIPADLLPPATK